MATSPIAGSPKCSNPAAPPSSKTGTPTTASSVSIFPRTDPNQDNYYAALEFADQVHRRYHLDFRVSSLLEDNATPAQKSAEIDLADFLFT